MVRTITGLTLEIGSRGACIAARPVPPVGALIGVVVSLPGLSSRHEAIVQLRGKGTVVRAEADGRFVVEVMFRVARVDDPKMTT